MSQSNKESSEMKIQFEEGSPVWKKVQPGPPKTGSHFPFITNDWNRAHKEIVKTIEKDKSVQTAQQKQEK